MLSKQDLRDSRLAIEKLLKLLGKVERFQRRNYQVVTCSGAQEGEDKQLSQLLPLEQPHAYVDVGAYGPEECSNTWHFYKAGWRGLLVEPLPGSFAPLLLQRPGDILWPKAAGNYNGMGCLRVCESVSSMRGDWEIPDRGEILVEVETLADILARFPEIRDDCELCSIDVEGKEQEVLQGIDWDTFQPSVFIVEYLEFRGAGASGRDLSGEWNYILIEHGYREVWRSAMNAIFLRNDLPSPFEGTVDQGAFI